ncbi:MAG: sigma-70 family RNA polymerase sigma factor [Flavobacteriaceae bacterium]|jgi:RNA polymerase sigma factor (sigma-70 family)|nr:sigma-70 family RNA polymerase sigma factor [Flavobacteriaceae bacterium]
MSKPDEKQNAEKFIVEYQSRLKTFIRKRVANKEEAEDILQDVFYQLVKTIETTEDPIEHIGAWLYRVARNMIINAGIRRKEKEWPVYRKNENDDIMRDFSEILFHDKATTSSPETEYLRSLVWIELENALSELPPKQREIFELTELNGISVKEIAETTGISVNTLLSRKHYAILHLRSRLKELYIEILKI